MDSTYLNKLTVDYINSLNIRVRYFVLISYSIISFMAGGVVMTLMLTNNQYSLYFEGGDLSTVVMLTAVFYAVWLCWMTFGILSAIMAIYLAITKNETLKNKMIDLTLGVGTFGWLGYVSVIILFNYRRKRDLEFFVNQLKKGSAR